jgi:hypothetical protein
MLKSPVPNEIPPALFILYQQMVHFEISFWISSLCMTLLSTILIILRILSEHCSTSRTWNLLQMKRKNSKWASNAVKTIVESSALYTISALIYIPMYARGVLSGPDLSGFNFELEVDSMYAGIFWSSTMVGNIQSLISTGELRAHLQSCRDYLLLLLCSVSSWDEHDPTWNGTSEEQVIKPSSLPSN